MQVLACNRLQVTMVASVQIRFSNQVKLFLSQLPDCGIWTTEIRLSACNVHLASTRRHLRVTCSQAFSVFHCSFAFVYYTERKLKNKKQGRPGNEAMQTPSFHGPGTGCAHKIWSGDEAMSCIHVHIFNTLCCTLAEFVMVN